MQSVMRSGQSLPEALKYSTLWNADRNTPAIDAHRARIAAPGGNFHQSAGRDRTSVASDRSARRSRASLSDAQILQSYLWRDGRSKSTSVTRRRCSGLGHPGPDPLGHRMGQYSYRLRLCITPSRRRPEQPAP